MRRILLSSLALSTILFASPVDDALKKCEVSTTAAIQRIKQQKEEIQALVQIINKQNEAGKWLVQGPDGKYTGKDKDSIKLTHNLEYHDGLYTIRIAGKLKRYDVQLNKKTGKYDVIDVPDYDIILDIKGTHDFKPGNVNPRPYQYFPNKFKLGGVLIPQSGSINVRGDIALMYEFFSFDRAFNFYGWSLNASVGVRHVGALFGYQLVNSQYLRNTNIVVGYAYDFLSSTHTPVFGVSLNF